MNTKLLRTLSFLAALWASVGQAASDLPNIELIHQEIPSPLNPLGVKGLGEGGAITPPVTLANAVCDALSPFGIEINTTPIQPEKLLLEIRK